MTGSITLDGFQGVVFVGGFSYADVLDSAKGWAATIKFNAKVPKKTEQKMIRIVFRGLFCYTSSRNIGIFCVSIWNSNGPNHSGLSGVGHVLYICSLIIVFAVVVGGGGGVGRGR